MPIGAVITTGISLVSGVVDLFKKEPTPEEQQQKAGVWYNMLADWVHNQPQDSYKFGARWKDLLPFKQSGTKSDFINNNINGKSYDSIVNTLCGKINDELVKGGFPKLSNKAILDGMQAGNQGIISSASQGDISGNVLRMDEPLDTTGNQEESKTFFFITVLTALSGLILAFSLGAFNKKKRRK